MAGRTRDHEIVPSYQAMLHEMLQLADHVIFLSATERAALEALGARVEDDCASLVVNPIDLQDWTGGDPALFRDAWLQNGGAAGSPPLAPDQADFA